MESKQEFGEETFSQERMEQIWLQRAVQMAQIESDGDVGEQSTVVLIRLGREMLGLEVDYVFDIRLIEAVTRVPRVPSWVLGVTNLRGRILSVIDLRVYLGLPAAAETPAAGEAAGFLVVVQSDAMEIIFRVDEVPGVETLPIRRDLSENLLHHLRPEQIRTVVERSDETSANRHITVLDVNTILQDPHLLVHEEFS